MVRLQPAILAPASLRRETGPPLVPNSKVLGWRPPQVPWRQRGPRSFLRDGALAGANAGSGRHQREERNMIAEHSTSGVTRRIFGAIALVVVLSVRMPVLRRQGHVGHSAHQLFYVKWVLGDTPHNEQAAGDPTLRESGVESRFDVSGQSKGSPILVASRGSQPTRQSRHGSGRRSCKRQRAVRGRSTRYRLVLIRIGTTA